MCTPWIVAKARGVSIGSGGLGESGREGGRTNLADALTWGGPPTPGRGYGVPAHEGAAWMSPPLESGPDGRPEAPCTHAQCQGPCWYDNRNFVCGVAWSPLCNKIRGLSDHPGTWRCGGPMALCDKGLSVGRDRVARDSHVHAKPQSGGSCVRGEAGGGPRP